MKKIVSLLLCLASILGCERLSGAVDVFEDVSENPPIRPISLKVDGVNYYSEMDNPSKLIAYHFPVKLKIYEGDEGGFSFKYLRSNIIAKGNGPEMYVLNLKMVSPEGTFAINHRYDISDESLTGRPLIMFKENTGNEYESMKTFYAKSGWIEFTECDPATMTMGGKFEFTAVYSKGDTSETIKVTEGSFSNIPYENATLEE